MLPVLLGDALVAIQRGEEDRIKVDIDPRETFGHVDDCIPYHDAARMFIVFDRHPPDLVLDGQITGLSSLNAKARSLRSVLLRTMAARRRTAFLHDTLNHGR